MPEVQQARLAAAVAECAQGGMVAITGVLRRLGPAALSGADAPKRRRG